MPDVTSAFVLPDVGVSTTTELINLSLVWDQIVVGKYGITGLIGPSLSNLEEAGIVQVLQREVDLLDHLPHKRLAPDDATETEIVFRMEKDEEGIRRAVEALTVESRAISSGPPRGSRAYHWQTAALIVDQHVADLQDALRVAAHHNLAPISLSIGSHLASLLAFPDEGMVPLREAALLSVAVESFAIDPRTPVESILRFRERTPAARAGFRASLVDLSASLTNEARPDQMLAAARDTYRNRVEPALARLEEALAENRVSFFIKSLIGATAIAAAPIEPLSAMSGSAHLIARSIDYSFSKQKLVREHPYGYLHQVSAEFGSPSRQDAPTQYSKALANPRRALQELWAADLRRTHEFLNSADH